MANEESPKAPALLPYPEMILAAIKSLDDKNGASKSAISSYIEEKYNDLPSSHASLLTANLAGMKEKGELLFVKNNYLRADAPDAPPPKRGRGRPPKPKDPNAPAPPARDPSLPKRGRGRPPKPKDPVAEAVAKATSGMPRSRGRPAKKPKVAQDAPAPAPSADSAAATPVKRGRGRPPKVRA